MCNYSRKKFFYTT